MAFLTEYGIVIPDELEGIDVHSLIEKIEANPDMVFVINSVPLYEFCEEVRAAVKDYYGWSIASIALASTYTLQHSVLHSWDVTTMPYYNCYAYALGRTVACQPGDFSNSSYDHEDSIYALAQLIEGDLNGDLGYACVKILGTCPTSTTGWENAICIKKDTTYDWNGQNDYHVAKLSGSSWYHKPGNTAVLRFINAPSNSAAWTNEAYFNGVYCAPGITYDSAAFYLLYKTDHGDAYYTYTGDNYHFNGKHYYLYANICEDCSEHTSEIWTSVNCPGPPCPNMALNIEDNIITSASGELQSP